MPLDDFDSDILDDYVEKSTFGEPVEDTEFDDFVADDLHIPARTIQLTDLSRFEPKQTVGPYDKDSDAIQSAWIATDWRGGQGIDTHTPGGTDQRYRSACAWSLNSLQLALPPKIERSSAYGVIYDGTGTGSTPYPNVFNATCPLGEFNNAMWYAVGAKLIKLTTVDNALDDVTETPIESLMYPPVNVGAIYGPPLADHSLPERRPRLWVPLGYEGIQNIRDDDGVSPLESTIKAVAVKAWDKHLWALTVDGYLRRYTQSDSDYPGTWEAALTAMKINRDQIPMGLEVFYDKSGNQTLFIATNKQMWAYDPDVHRIVATSLEVPRHPDNGWGFKVWRDDFIHYATGIGVERYSRDAVNTPVGLDRDDGIDINRLADTYPTVAVNGLPFTSQFGDNSTTSRPLAQAEVAPTVPFIASMASSLNYLIASIGRGVTYNEITGNYDSRMSIEVYNELGWHTIADFEVSTDGCWVTPGPMTVTDTVGGYRLWMGMLVWGVDMATLAGPELPVGNPLDDYTGNLRLVSIQLPRHRSGPRQQVQKQVMRFERRGYLETGWYTSGMEGFDKLNSHFEVYLEKPRGVDEVKGYVGVYMRTMEDPESWQFIGRATEFGRNLLPMGVDKEGFPRGIGAQGVEFRYVFVSDDENYSPIVRTTIDKYIKLPLPGRAWITNVPLDSENWRGIAPDELDDKLASKTYEPQFSKVVINDRIYRARFAQHQAIGGAGRVPYRNATVNIVEVPIPGHPVDVPHENIHEVLEGLEEGWEFGATSVFDDHAWG